MNDFLNALANARDEYRQEEYIDRLKKLFRSKIEELDNTAVVEDTHYFNHSAIPDFVVSWRGEKARRNLFLRGSYASILASNEVESTSAESPVFMSLDATQDFTGEMPPISPEMIKDEPLKAGGTLLTDVRAMGEMLEPPRQIRTPLTRLVQSSFVRGGRGLIDEPRAEALVKVPAQSEADHLAEVVRESFVENVAARMERTAAIIALASGGDQSIDSQTLAKITGRLSESELQEILPWLLQQDQQIESRAFWRQIGAMTSFKDLEKIADDLEGLDISPLIAVNAGSWEAQRAYLGVSTRLTNEASREEDRSLRSTRPAWMFRAGVLGVDAGIHRVMLSVDGRTLKGRDDGSFPQWETLKSNLSAFRLSSVNLRGITRSVRIDAEESDDIRKDVENVAESLDDSYTVSEVALEFAPRETKDGSASVAVRFGKGLAISTGGATISDLTRSTLQVLAHRSPISLAELDQVLIENDIPLPVALTDDEAASWRTIGQIDEFDE